MKQLFIVSDNQEDTISYVEREPAILVSMSRSDLPSLKEKDFASFPAVYVLMGGNKRYIGQAAGQSIALRLSQHFLKSEMDWVESVLFFTRVDGKMSKADTDYLEKRLIQEFHEKTDYEITNATAGNRSYIDKLQKAKSDHLFDAVLEILNEIATIDLFAVVENEEVVMAEQYGLEYDGKKLASKTARGLLIAFVKELLADEYYKDQLRLSIVDKFPTFAHILGRKPTPKGGPQSTSVAEGVWLYTNFSKKAVRTKINKLARDLNIAIKIKWN